MQLVMIFLHTDPSKAVSPRLHFVNFTTSMCRQCIPSYECKDMFTWNNCIMQIASQNSKCCWKTTLCTAFNTSYAGEAILEWWKHLQPARTWHFFHIHSSPDWCTESHVNANFCLPPHLLLETTSLGLQQNQLHCEHDSMSRQLWKNELLSSLSNMTCTAASSPYCLFAFG